MRLSIRQLTLTTSVLALFGPAELFAASEPGIWLDPSDITTLFQDTAGTVPVAAPGDPVALALDKSKGLVLGSELVTNGDFSSGTGWTVTPEVTISGGVATFTASASSSALFRSASVVVGRTYEITVVVTSVSSGTIRPRLFGGAATPLIISAAGTYTFKDVLTTSNFNVGFVTTGPFTGVVDNISVKELPGFHAALPSGALSGTRPIYGIHPLSGIRNLLTFTEQFDNAAWTKTRSSITANAGVAPDGTTTADKLVEDSTVNNTHLTLQAPSGIVAGAYTATVYAKSVERSRVVISNEETSGLNGVYAVFNLSTGAIDVAATAFGTGFSGGAATITSVGNGWYRCSVSGSTSATTRRISINLDNATSGALSQTYTGNGTSGILIWGAQLETGSTATAYQRVVNQYNVTQTDVDSVHYLSFDGVDDCLVTPTITPGIDKVQVFAGVRKLSDAAGAILVESSVNSGANAGAFYLAAPESTTSSDRYSFIGRGSATAATGHRSLANTGAAPDQAVLTGQGDISADSNIIRRNGVAFPAGTLDQGTGNYLAYPLYIGRRAGSTIPFNGRLYSLIVRFGTNLTTDQIVNAETWVNVRTGAY